MIRRPPRSTPLYSSAASDVYKRQLRAKPQSVLSKLPSNAIPRYVGGGTTMALSIDQPCMVSVGIWTERLCVGLGASTRHCDATSDAVRSGCKRSRKHNRGCSTTGSLMGRRLDNGSRVNREIYARFCERLWVKPPRPTHPCILVKGVWKYLYRAVDKAGETVDFLLTAKRDKAAARRFLERAINLHAVSYTHLRAHE